MRDKYSSLAALRASLETKDYRIRCLDRGSTTTIISPHGGFIEAGTSALATAIAGRKYNLFDFQGLRPDIAHEMHVTATRFREAQLSKMLKTSQQAVSVHGMGVCAHTTIWLGGLNYDLKELVYARLLKYGFEVNPDSPKYRGESPNNVVNLACHRGVQLELSNELLAILFVDAPFQINGRRPQTTKMFSALVLAIRQAIAQYTLQFGSVPCTHAEHETA